MHVEQIHLIQWNQLKKNLATVNSFTQCQGVSGLNASWKERQRHSRRHSRRQCRRHSFVELAKDIDDWIASTQATK